MIFSKDMSGICRYVFCEKISVFGDIYSDIC